MEKYKKLFNDSIIFSIGNFGSKIITFAMLPLYTYALTTSEYGKVDLLITSISLLLPIVGLSVYESVLRFSMDKFENYKKIFSNSFFVTIVASILLIMVIPFIILINKRLIILPLLLVVQLFQNLFSQYAKARNKLKIFAANGILLSFLTAGLNILFLVPLKMGLDGYLISLFIANLCSTVYLGMSLKIFNDFDRKLINRLEIRKQLQFSIPLIPNSIAWWMTNAVGRYFILLFLGASANGLYAVSSKIPTLLTVFTSIFTQSWQISAIEEYDESNNNEFLDRIYYYYFFLLFLGSSFLIIFLKPVMTILVSDTFFEAWKYVPFLLLSVIYSSVSGFLGAQYIAMKDTVGVFKTTLTGAFFNIILSLILVPFFGLQGVGISSFLSFLVVWIIRHHRLNKIYKLNFSMYKWGLSMFFLIVQTILSIIDILHISLLIQVLCLIGLSYIYWEDYKIIFSTVKRALRKDT